MSDAKRDEAMQATVRDIANEAGVPDMLDFAPKNPARAFAKTALAKLAGPKPRKPTLKVK
jgi:hypothetical protein